MNYELRTMKASGGDTVEYVRITERNRHTTIVSAVGLWRFPPEIREAIRAGRPI